MPVYFTGSVKAIGRLHFCLLARCRPQATQRIRSHVALFFHMHVLTDTHEAARGRGGQQRLLTRCLCPVLLSLHYSIVLPGLSNSPEE